MAGGIETALTLFAFKTGSKRDNGGMFTKVRAARLAARSGAVTVIAYGAEDEVIKRVYQGEAIGTLLLPDQEPVVARKPNTKHCHRIMRMPSPTEKRNAVDRLDEISSLE